MGRLVPRAGRPVLRQRPSVRRPLSHYWQLARKGSGLFRWSLRSLTYRTREITAPPSGALKHPGYPISPDGITSSKIPLEMRCSLGKQNMKKDIALVDRGRGLQLSTSRITVQDLVPYFQRGCSYEEIMRWMPTLNRDEIALVEKYYSENKNELDEEDRRIRAYVAEQVRLQQIRFPEEPREVRLARMKERLRQRQQERNGEGNPG